MVLDEQYQTFKPVRSKMAIFINPLQCLVDSPFRCLVNLRRYCQRFESLERAYQALAQTQRLKEAQCQRLSSLEFENTTLRSLLKITPSLSQPFIMAEILRVQTDLLSQQIILNRGSDEGVTLGQVVMNAQGILGEVVAVYKHLSCALLLSNAGYGIPVQNMRSGFMGIVAGHGFDRPLILQHVPNTIDIEVGDSLVTSGLEGRYPAGYQVGTIIAVSPALGEPFAEVQVKLSADYRLTRHVLLIKAADQSD